MLYDNLRRGLSLMLAFVMAFLFLPLLARTAEAETPETSNATVDITAVTEPVNENEISEEVIMQELQQEMDKILLKYLHATVLTEDEVIDIVNTMYWDDMEEAVAACEALEPKFAALSEGKLVQLQDTYDGADTIVCFYETMQLAMTPTVFADGSYTPVLDANNAALVSVGVSNATSTSEDSGSITVTAKGSWGLFSGYTPKTATITITNSSKSDKATVSFDWTGTSVNSLKINQSDVSKTGGSYDQLLEAGASITVTLTSGSNTTTNTLVLKNFKWEKAADSSKVKFDYDSTLGSITVDGAVMADEGEKDIPLTGAALVATAGSNATFLGWIDGNNKILSTAASFTLKPAAAMTAKAVFVANNSTEAWFQVGADYLFNDLNAADTFAKTAVNRFITLVRSGTLPSGKKYTISSGNSFLIPYSSTDTGNFGGNPTVLETSTGATGAFLTLTIPDNVELTVAGAMSINAAQGAPGAGDTGQVTGKFGHVVLNGSNAKITVTGSLTCYGYITGTGIVHAMSGAKVYELFQLRDWRGGSATMTWYNEIDLGLIKIGEPKTNSFVVNEYYIQNIETRYRVDAGALSYVNAAMSMAVVGVQQAQAVYIGSGGLFQLGTGSFVIREYKASEDRIYYDLYGTVTTAGIDLQVSTYKLNTSSFILGIHHSMTITVKGKDLSGNSLSSYATISKAFKLMPGAELIVEENGTLEIKSDTTVYLYDLKDWVKDGTAANSYIYWGDDSFTAVQTVRYTPSKKGTRKTQQSARLQIDGELIGYSNIFTTADGSTQPDKVLSGTGKFTNNAAASGYEQVALDEMKNNSADNVANIATAPVIGLLAGISTDATDVNDSFGTGEYHGIIIKNADGTETNWWYKNTATQAATCTAAGYTRYWCDDETKYIQVDIPALGHNMVAGEVVAPTCTGGGYTIYTCSRCGATENGDFKDPLGHAWGEPTYKWSDDGKSACTATRVCGNDAAHVESATATVTSAVKTPADCTNVGITTYTAKFSVDWAAEQTNDLDDIPAAGHDHQAVVTPPTCTEEGFTTYTCSKCGDSYVSDKVQANGHSYESVVTAPTFDADGYTTYTCTVCGDSYVVTKEGSKLTVVAMIGTTRYNSLAAAYEALLEGDTIVILDASASDENVTFDKCAMVDASAVPSYEISTATGFEAVSKGTNIWYVRNSALFDIYASNIKAGDTLDLFFYVNVGDLEGVDKSEFTAEIVRYRKGVADALKIIPGSEWTYYNRNSLLRICYDDIAAKEMTDKIFITIYKAGEKVSNTRMETIENYALRVLKSLVIDDTVEGRKNAALRTSMVDMLNYGAACQAAFKDYNIENPANANLGAFSAYASSDQTAINNTSGGDGYIMASSVTAETSLVYTLYFDSTAVTTDMAAYVTYVNHSGTTVKLPVITGESFNTTKSGLIGVNVTGLAIADGKQIITCTIKNGTDESAETVTEVKGSVESYIAIDKVYPSNEATTAALQKLMNFIVSAHGYFHFGET